MSARGERRGRASEPAAAAPTPGPFSSSWQTIRGLMEGERPEPRPMGVRMKLHHGEASPGRWSGEVEFERGGANSQGIIHGGHLASILDVAMGYASLTMLRDREWQRTLEMKINFLRGVPPDRVKVDAEMLRRGRTTAYCEGTVRTADGELVARASATFAIRREKGD